MRNDYSLEIISQHEQFKGKSLRKYYVDGIESVGAWGDEPFEIKFRNHTGKKLQVKLSLDGTDILTGKPATTDVTKDMWVVGPFQTLSLKAWPETTNGGSQFVFTSGTKSVALHTHGDTSNLGIIAAAVYEEAYKPPTPLQPIYVPYAVPTPVYPRPWPYSWADSRINNRRSRGLQGRGAQGAGGVRQTSFSADSLSLGDSVVSSAATEQQTTAQLDSLVSVGAGQHVEQNINYVQGLVQPFLAQTVRVKYMWWDDLQAKLRANNVPAPHPSGFPGDKEEKLIDLKKTPKVGEYSGTAFPKQSQESFQSYMRV